MGLRRRISVGRSSAAGIVILIALSLIFYTLTHITTTLPSIPSPSFPHPQYHFLTSLENFLLTHSPPLIHNSETHLSLKHLDDRISLEQTQRLHAGHNGVVRVYVYEMPTKFTYDLLWLFRNTYRETNNLTSNGSPVHRLIQQTGKRSLGLYGRKANERGVRRVYVYEMPMKFRYDLHWLFRNTHRETLRVYEMLRKFTYDLLWLFHNTCRETFNLTSNGSPVYRLIEQHSIDYWLWVDLIAPKSQRLLNNVVRVQRQEEADLFYIPFFTTISFFLLEKQPCKALYREALKWVTDQPAWKRSEGRDHILPVHHPWSFKSVRKYMKNAIWLLPDMDSTGNWYKPGQVSLEKDLILPYVANVDFCNDKCKKESETKRSTLLFFRGRLKRNAGGKIRSKLVGVLTGVDGIVIEEGTAGEAGKQASQNGMRKSIFCLSPAGDTPSSARLFDAIVSGCIPVVVSDELELPFEGLLDYRKIALFVSSSDAVQPGWLLKYLKSISSTQLREMREHLTKYSRHFLYSHPAQPLGPEDLAWRMITGKVVNIKLHTRRSQRVVRESRSVCSCDCRRANSTSPSSMF